jgi:hypothetical protein
MKKRLGLFGLVFALYLIANVSAGIYFSQPEQTYNLGDEISNTIKIEPMGVGFLEIDLVCDGASVNIFNGIPIEGEAEVRFPLTTNYIQNISGNCYFLGNYDGVDKRSREFKISKKLIIRLDIDSLFAQPGEEIIISGNAERLNGEGVNGEVEIKIIGLLESVIENSQEDNETEENEENNETEENNEVNETEEIEEVGSVVYDSGLFSGIVKDGAFSVNLDLARDVPAQDYRIEVLVYEKLDDEKTSQGLEFANLKISQVLKDIDIALNEQSLNPGSNLNFKPMLLDQTGKSIDDNVAIIITNKNSKRIFEEIVKSGETINYEIPFDMGEGYYEINAKNKNLSVIKKFYIQKKAIVSIELRNETVIVTCVGNVKCDKPIQIELNGKPFVKELNLKIGEIQEFRLSGVSGTYDVKISDGETELVRGGVILTGNAVNVKELGKGFISTPLVWIFFIIILGAGALFVFKNVLKKKSIAYPFKGKFKKKKIADLIIPKEKSKKDVEDKSVENKLETTEGKKKESDSTIKNKAEQVLVLKGQKSQATALVLKIKNKLTEVSKKSLEKAISLVYEKKGAVYEQGDFIYIIYSPLMTKSFKNEAEAANAAEKIKLVLQEHNKKFKDKIEFGMGINSGNIINKIEDKKLKFTALGNLISGAKKIADSSNEQVLITDEVYKKGINEIKAEKKEVNGKEVYEVRQVVDKEKNKEFISGFLKRMAGEKK